MISQEKRDRILQAISILVLIGLGIAYVLFTAHAGFQYGGYQR